MTNNLINIILATCLLFSSLNLNAEQVSFSNSKAEAQFLAGETCLKQTNTACAMAALAKIPSSSPYAKLLQGEIAYTNQALDQALQLLLPLQADTQFTMAAKASLHQYLANAFAQLQDTEQSLVHLLQVDLALSSAPSSNQQYVIADNQARIWGLLNKLEQSELLAMRGNNTDDTFQGWVDLALAAKHKDLSSSFESWQISYQDHPAATFASTLQRKSSNPNAQQPLQLPSADDITITYLASTEEDKARAEAFKTGLATALSHHGLNNAIQMHAPTNDAANNVELDVAADNTETPQAANAYAIALNFSQTTDATDVPTQQITNPHILTLGLHLDAEAEQIVKFAISNAISHVALLTTEDAAAAEMVKHLNAAWQQAFNLNAEHDSFNIITLTQDITANDPSLLDIQTKISAKAHDMVVLALPVADARTIKPYLNVGTPTLAFSNLHEIDIDPTLNTVRFVEIPFLLPSSAQFTAYKNVPDSLTSNDLLRWYALGVDALSILVTTQQASEKEVIFNGLTGKISIKHGNITRQPTMARFTYEGITQE